jgi:hypothetical protein
MTPQMDVLYVKDLGHVLAAFTRVSEPDQLEASAAAFLTTGLYVRGLGNPAGYPSPSDFNSQNFLVPPDRIALARVALNSAQLAAPRALTVTISPSSPPTVSSFPSIAPLTITTGPLKVTLAQPAAADTPFLILLDGPSLDTPIEQPCIFPQGALDFTPTLPAISTLSGGVTYYAIVFVPNYPVSVHNFMP